MDWPDSTLSPRFNRITMRDNKKDKKDKKDHHKEDRPKTAKSEDRPKKDKKDKEGQLASASTGKPGPVASGSTGKPGPSGSGSVVEAFLACARQSLGGEYCTPAREPDCTDCSGLVRRCYQQATGQDIGGDSHEQFKLGTEIARSEVQPGDLLFWDTMNGTENRGGNTASHVGIATGGNRMINALTWGMKTAESDLGSNYWTTQVRFLGARRLNF
jgi:cell wall-associated NlpC family hydrolase